MRNKTSKLLTVYFNSQKIDINNIDLVYPEYKKGIKEIKEIARTLARKINTGISQSVITCSDTFMLQLLVLIGLKTKLHLLSLYDYDIC